MVYRKITDKQIISLLKEHNALLDKYKVKRIGLFGSYARNEQKKNSDIDLLVSFKEPTFDNFMGLTFMLEDVFNRKVDLTTEKGLSPYMRPYVEKEVLWYEG